MMFDSLVLLVLTSAMSVEYDEHIDRAHALIGNMSYAEAWTEAEVARTLVPDDPESYDTAAIATILEVTHRLDAMPFTGKRPPRSVVVRSCEACFPLIQLARENIAQGLGRVEVALATDPTNARLLTLHARLFFDQLWLDRDILDAGSGAGPVKRSRELAQRALARDPTSARARVVLGWIEYGVGAKDWLSRQFAGGGNKERGLTLFWSVATCEACRPRERIEALFSLLDVLQREHRKSEALGVARSLRVDFPNNTLVCAALTAEERKECLID